MSIEAMKLALEALEQMYCCYANPKFISHKQQEAQIIEQTKDAMASLRQAIEQAQKQEPVAWSCGCCNGSGWVVRDPDIGTDQECFVCEGTGKNIDTSPPQRQPLTDKEILAVARNHYNPYQRAEISFARAIEATHNIKGEA